MNEEEFLYFVNNMDDIINISDKNEIDNFITKQLRNQENRLGSVKRKVFESEKTYSERRAAIVIRSLHPSFSSIFKLNWSSFYDCCLYADDDFFYQDRELYNFDDCGRDIIYKNLFYFLRIFSLVSEKLEDIGIREIHSELHTVGFPKFKIKISRYGNTIIF